MNIWIYIFIIPGGCLRAAGSAMNGQLYKSLQNPWLASLVSFTLISAFFLCMTAIIPRPLPSAQDIQLMPWWAPLAGLVGAVAVYAGLKFVGTVGAGTYTGLNVTAALIFSLVIDHFGMFRLQQHPVSIWRIGFWSGHLPGTMSKGRHLLPVRATDAAGRVGHHAVRFVVDPSGRFTPSPAVDPIVEGTLFC